MSQLTFWSEEHLVSHSQSPESEAEWMTTVANWPLLFPQLLAATALGGLSGKMSLEFCQADAEKILAPFSGVWQNSGMVAPTECWTLSTSESPNDAVACSLSDTLETGAVPQRYFLSAKACAGILRRAEKRGKELPSVLLSALSQASGQRVQEGQVETSARI